MIRADVMPLFKQWLRDCGAEVLGPTSEWEVLRVVTYHGTQVVHRNKKGNQIWPPHIAAVAQQFLNNEFPSLSAGRRARKSSKMRQRYSALVERDGNGCFYCGEVVPEPDIPTADGYGPTIEHLVPHAHGGPNHLSNCFLAHSRCNNIAGALSAVQKIKLREKMRKAANDNRKRTYRTGDRRASRIRIDELPLRHAGAS
jgi:5-methylcytosine-specific restriction endonuclease McrA